MTTTFSNVIRGVAYGDAWGDPNEFRRLADLTKNDLKGPDLPAKLFITDDTQMSLFLADALDESRNSDMQKRKKAIIDAFLVYYKDPDTGSRAPGTTVMGSLGSLWHISGDLYAWWRSTNDHSDGSGTVMRTSPVAFVDDEWVGVAAFAAAVTHGTANGIAAAILNVAVLKDILAGQVGSGQLTAHALELASHPRQYGLLEVGDWLENYEVPGGLEKGFEELTRLLTLALADLPKLQADPWAYGSDPSKAAGMGGVSTGGGWRAHETLVIALLAVDMIPDDPWLALRRSVTSEGDSDTIGAVAGALIGATGFQWPEGVFERLEDRYQKWIENEADDYLFNPEPEVAAVAAK